MTDTYMGSVFGGSYLVLGASGAAGALVGVYRGKKSTRYPDWLHYQGNDKR